MTDHADTIRRARDNAQKLASEFTEGDPSDVWTQGEVYEHIYDPLDKDARALCDLAESILAENRKFRILLAEGTKRQQQLVAERQHAIEERDEARREWEASSADWIKEAERAVAAELRCERAIDALRRNQNRIHEVLKGDVPTWATYLLNAADVDIDAALLSLGEQP